MERVAFLLEETNERLGCLLNPESLVLRRVAGIASRRTSGGQWTGIGLRDDPLLYTGGGKTELELKLLFDVSLAGSSIQTNDVRDLTAPLWNLAENTRRANGSLRPSLVRFVWGKSWNIPGVVAAVAEYLEQFSESGAPQRSWLSMRLWRVNEPVRETSTDHQYLPTNTSLSSETLALTPAQVPAERLRVHTVSQGERLDEIAAHYYPDRATTDAPALWRLLASFNALPDPLNIPAGTILQIPPLSMPGGTPS